MPKPSSTSTKINAAIDNPDRGVTEKTTRVQPASFASQVAALEPGEHITKSLAVNETVTLRMLPVVLNDMKDALRNNTAPSVRQAKARTGGEYSIEISDMRTLSGRMFVVAVVIRVI
jgi:hypothetical protein